MKATRLLRPAAIAASLFLTATSTFFFAEKGLWLSASICLLAFAGTCIWLHRKQNRQVRILRSFILQKSHGRTNELPVLDTGGTASTAELEREIENMLASYRKQLLDETAQQQYYKHLLDHVDTGVVSCDEKGQIQWMNRAAEQQLGSRPVLPERWLASPSGTAHIVHVERHGQIHELLLSLTDSGRITDEMIAHHMAGTIQGVIYLQCANYPELIVPLEKAKIPCVIAADSMNHTEAVRTFIDFRATAREAVRHLVRRGHRRIGILTGSEKQFLYSEMLAGFRGALAEENLPFDPQWCLSRLEYEQSADQVGVIARFLKRVPREELPTAFFTVRDYRAGWFFEAAEQLGLRIPEEISLLSFDNHSWRGAEQAGLTTFAEPLREQGEQAVKLLGDWVLSGSRPASVEFKPKLIERTSVGAPRG